MLGRKVKGGFRGVRGIRQGGHQGKALLNGNFLVRVIMGRRQPSGIREGAIERGYQRGLI